MRPRPVPPITLVAVVLASARAASAGAAQRTPHTADVTSLVAEVPVQGVLPRGGPVRRLSATDLELLDGRRQQSRTDRGELLARRCRDRGCRLGIGCEPGRALVEQLAGGGVQVLRGVVVAVLLVRVAAGRRARPGSLRGDRLESVDDVLERHGRR